MRSKFHTVKLPTAEPVAPYDPRLDDDRDVLDAALFRYWIKLASTTPSRVARAIAPCVTSGEYRAALIALAREDRINLPYPPEGPAPLYEPTGEKVDLATVSELAKLAEKKAP